MMETSRFVTAFFASFFLIISSAGTGKASIVRTPANGLFGTSEFWSYSITQFPQWDRVLNNRYLQRLEIPYSIADDNRCMQFGSEAWCRLLKNAASLDQIAQLEIVNSFFNNMPYRSDREAYGVSEYWATPMEFMARSGDCEDYSIAKYFALRELGFDEDQLRIVILRDEIHGTGHVVLAVTLNQENLILDNTSDRIVSDTTYKNYVPQYSFNETGYWVHVKIKSTELDDLLAKSSGIELSEQEKSVLMVALQKGTEPGRVGKATPAIENKLYSSQDSARKMSRYVVQIASVRTPSAAQSEWARLQQAHGSVLGRDTPILKHVDLGDRGKFTRIQVGPFGNYASAAMVCTALKENKQDCFIVKR